MRGGKRSGAGRKPLPKGEKQVTISVVLSPGLLKSLNQAAKEAGVTRSAFVANCVYKGVK